MTFFKAHYLNIETHEMESNFIEIPIKMNDDSYTWYYALGRAIGHRKPNQLFVSIELVAYEN